MGDATRTLLIVPELTFKRGPDPNMRTPDARLQEAKGLAAAIGLKTVHTDISRLSVVRPATLFGTGKTTEFAELCTDRDIDLAIVDCPLNPVQQRNLEKHLKVKVLDRTGLILEIFGARAQTAEGRLQVEIAHLNWQKSRLVRSWTHLERQRGGFGFLGGPGETQIEADRRQIQERITRLEGDLRRVRERRRLHRKRRAHYPSVALVGYTNAGKTTLFNALTGAGVAADKRLFATLDPAARAADLPHGGKIVLSDTVGFVSDLPTHLVAAFRATLEEVLEADLILHVRDISHPDSAAQATDVMQTLGQLDPGDALASRIVEVWNKIDQIETRDTGLSATRNVTGSQTPVSVSALKRLGMENLLACIADRLSAGSDVFHVLLAADQGATLAWLHNANEVLSRHDSAQGIRMEVRVSERNRAHFKKICGGYLVQ